MCSYLFNCTASSIEIDGNGEVQARESHSLDSQEERLTITA
jgi:hypothetical protein